MSSKIKFSNSKLEKAMKSLTLEAIENSSLLKVCNIFTNGGGKGMKYVSI